MRDWDLPREGGCRCGQVRIKVGGAAAGHHGLPLHRLPEDEFLAPFRCRPPSPRRVSP